MAFRSIFLLAVVAALPLISAGDTPASHALLVGVSQYPSLDRSQWLKGPVNDVQLVGEVLAGPRYKFPGKNIRTLAGWPKEEADRPTKANIKNAYKALAAKAGKNDIVFILMSGHGSQQPANPDPKDIETDGLDEVFLPADTTKWDPKTKTIRGAITDDEIRVWVDAIRDKGAHVWIIFDSCHSGTMTRGTAHAGRVNRRVDPENLVPAAALSPGAPSPRALAVEVESDLARSGKSASPGRGKLVAMYAAQSLEPTFELPMPPPYGPRRGLFTTTLMEVLVSASGTLSYRDLAETVSIVYRSNGILQPTPLVEGDGLDRPVLGKGRVAKRADVVFTGILHPKHGFEVNAGHLHGLGKGTVLDVIPAAVTGGEKSLGTVKVVHTEATRSFVQPHAWEQHPAAEKKFLGAACRASILYQELGLATLAVAMQVQGGDGSWSTINPDKVQGVPAALVKVLRKRSAGRFKVVADAKMADWFYQIHEAGGGALVAASGYPEGLAAPQFSVQSADALADGLGRIARARQLIHVAGTRPRGARLPVKVELIRFDKPGDEKGSVVAYGGDGRQLRAGDEVCFRIKNEAAFPVDVTLLHVDDGFAISALYPEPGTIDDNRIPSGQVLDTPRMEVTADRTVREQVVAIAVRATRDRQDFTCLGQPSLETTRGERALQTPLGQLLRSTVYGSGETRGLRRSETGSYTTSLLTWTARP